MTNCIHDHNRWGKGDQIGAAGHLLTPERTLTALRNVRQGVILDLSHTIAIGAPHLLPNQSPYHIQAGPTAPGSIRRRRKLGASNDAGSNLERIEMTTHVGTHIDALGHFSIGDRLYGGYSVADTVDDFGLTHLGIENMPPLVTRGILLDVSRLDGGDHLEAGRAVTIADLEKALAAAKLTIQPGDVVCINTGWGRYFMTDNARYLSGEPGIDLSAAQWLTRQDCVAIAADNMALEVLPGTNHPAVMMPVHQHCLAEAGVHIIENLVMDPLIERNITSFCFMLAAVKFKGATGCPVRPIALV
ncbi:MAG: cyclase family protein [Hyphomicrobiaceae bacterium]|nr:cyclase family protein [Hyphomicrobiaceae bacterium]